tara:strand:- start:2153 stop:2542 length:390 start_codon:yes stop_codon:yes gene_type:complete
MKNEDKVIRTYILKGGFKLTECEAPDEIRAIVKDDKVVGIHATRPPLPATTDMTFDEYSCRCQNDTSGSGFDPCDDNGVYQEPTIDWSGKYVCVECSLILSETWIPETKRTVVVEHEYAKVPYQFPESY